MLALALQAPSWKTKILTAKVPDNYENLDSDHVKSNDTTAVDSWRPDKQIALGMQTEEVFIAVILVPFYLLLSYVFDLRTLQNRVHRAL